jgi:tripartite-type tricarboxylate transporter receptor subunit TctC
MTLRGLCAFIALMLITTSNGFSQGYPVKPLRLIVPFPPGGGADTVARIMSQKLTEAMGQQVVIDNRAGAGGIIGLETAARAAPDGYTLLLAPSGPLVIHPSLYRKLAYDTVRDFEPISLLTSTPLILVTHPSLPVTSIKELVQYAREHAGKLNFASVGKGGSSHLAAELFMQMTSTHLVHVPYKGLAPALNGILSGEVQLMFGSMAALPQIRSGRLRALAVTSAGRSSALPQVPTVSEAGVPGYATASWYGLLAPAGTPRPVVDRLYREFNKILDTRDLREKLVAEGSDPIGNSPREFGEYIKSELARWARVIEHARIELD